MPDRLLPDHLVVWLGSDRIGELHRERRSLRFIGTPGARGTTSLTVAVDGVDERWAPGFTRAWFDGLLPEEERRSAAEREHGVEPGDTFGLLAAIGWECAGAVSILPETVAPASGTYHPLDDAEVWERLDALPRGVSPIDHAVRLSLGGAQNKLLLARLGDRWHLPIDGATSTHILKPEPERYPGLAVAEAWSLAVAGAVTKTAKASLETPTGHRPTLVVHRYDRHIHANGIMRVHQEDGCQVLGLSPGDKYPRGAGPREASLARIAGVLFARAVDPPGELGRLLEQVIVNIALLNTDAHAKNVSVIHTGAGTVSLSPLYDVAPTLWFLPTLRRVALPVGEKWVIDEITRRHLLAEATVWGIPEAPARATITRALDALRVGMAEADRRYPDLPPDLRATVDRNVKRLEGSSF